MAEDKLKRFQLAGFITAIIIFSGYCYSISSDDNESSEDKTNNVIKNTKENNTQDTIIQDFQKKYLLKKFINKYAIGYYYLWWKTEKDLDFTKSKTKELILQINQEILGIESYIINDITRNLEVIINEEKFEIPNNESDYNLTFKTIDNKIILLTIDKNLGLSFHFRKEDGETYRDEFLNDLYNYIKAMKKIITSNNKELDKNTSECLDFTKLIIKESLNKEEVDKVGIILVSKDIKRKKD
ncbi:MAG: hypothetical protein U0457_03515 [Candidatus Sericytochromatia bacterium]